MLSSTFPALHSKRGCEVSGRGFRRCHRCPIACHFRACCSAFDSTTCLCRTCETLMHVPPCAVKPWRRPPFSLHPLQLQHEAHEALVAGARPRGGRRRHRDQLWKNAVLFQLQCNASSRTEAADPELYCGKKPGLMRGSVMLMGILCMCLAG